MIYGIVYRAAALCTVTKDRLHYIKKAYIRLLARGDQSSIILQIFNSSERYLRHKKEKHQIKDKWPSATLPLPTFQSCRPIVSSDTERFSRHNSPR